MNSISTSNILGGIILLGSIAHVMIFMNGLWSPVFWVSAMLVVAIPIFIYKYLNLDKKRRLPRTTIHDDL
ncbi:MAG: hypothetical protein OES14_06360 [Nitrosopumilus sp.]|nr:hypothetical protein [Nitrosopumilus sp.]MDH3825398.1 hypothetical protein [Nitrosopumilus sp.]